MSAIDLPIREPFFRSVRASEEADTGTFWCHMHAKTPGAARTTRPCFSTQLLDDLRSFQLWVSDRIARRTGLERLQRHRRVQLQLQPQRIRTKKVLAFAQQLLRIAGFEQQAALEALAHGPLGSGQGACELGDRQP